MIVVGGIVSLHNGVDRCISGFRIFTHIIGYFGRAAFGFPIPVGTVGIEVGQGVQTDIVFGNTGYADFLGSNVGVDIGTTRCKSGYGQGITHFYRSCIYSTRCYTFTAGVIIVNGSVFGSTGDAYHGFTLLCFQDDDRCLGHFLDQNRRSGGFTIIVTLFHRKSFD